MRSNNVRDVYWIPRMEIRLHHLVWERPVNNTLSMKPIWFGSQIDVTINEQVTYQPSRPRSGGCHWGYAMGASNVEGQMLLRPPCGWGGSLVKGDWKAFWWSPRGKDLRSWDALSGWLEVELPVMGGLQSNALRWWEACYLLGGQVGSLEVKGRE